METAKSPEIRVYSRWTTWGPPHRFYLFYGCLLLAVFLFVLVFLTSRPYKNPNDARVVHLYDWRENPGYGFLHDFDDITAVESGSVAENSGLTTDDRIININGVDLSIFEQDRTRDKTSKDLVLIRGDRNVWLVVRSEKMAPLSERLIMALPHSVLTVLCLLPFMALLIVAHAAEQLKHTPSSEVTFRRSSGEYGLVIRGSYITEVVYHGSAQSELKKWDKIVKVNGKDITETITVKIIELFEADVLQLVVKHFQE